MKEKYEQEKALLEKYGEDTVNLTKRYEQEKARIKAGEGEKNISSNNTGFGFKKLQIENEIKDENERNLMLAKLEEDRILTEKKGYEELLKIDNLTDEERERYTEKVEECELRLQEAKLKTQKVMDEIHQQEMERIKAEREAQIELVQTIASIMGTVADAWQDAIERRVEEGKISEEEGEKEFERVKALQIASATINTIAGAIAAFMSAQSLTYPLNLIIGAASAAAVTASGIAQIAKIKSTSIGGGGSLSEGGSSSGVATPTQQAVQYAPQYSTQVTGQSDTVNLANAVGAAQGDQRVYVVESDIAQAGKKVEVRESESTF